MMMRRGMEEWKETPSVPLLRGRSACRGLEGAGLEGYGAAKLGCDETRGDYTSSFFILL